MNDNWKNSLKLLGFGDSHVESIELALSMPSGAIIASGPTWSGKSKTLHTLLQAPLREDIHPSLKPKEPASKLDFATVAAENFWVDPELYYLPEIRDENCVSACAEFVNTGHRVMAKIHAATAFHVPVRLHHLGKGQQFKISALINQRLVNCVCSECSLALGNLPVSETLDTWFTPALDQNIPADQRHNLRFRNPLGCPSCKEGYTGRTAVVEVVAPDAPMLECLHNLEWEKAARMFRDAGGKFLIDHALEKVMAGQVDLRDVAQRIGFDYLEEIRRPQA
ncbi:ATPase, T2SS/T4P/T4SS family [Pseudomonas serbica]|uniref:ATPase, T2SS/T4P/T4SS family n=1 Tax=Pseudomonas serbica TaxID=2965074 RepID=UPI00237C1855|nr:ATPase, T2SS/T4P/T4SS family [Pseudomonas serbica]